MKPGKLHRCLRIIQPLARGHIILPKHHSVESSFCRNPILPNRYFAERKNCRKSFDGIVESAKLHNAERNFSESLFSRTSFSRIVVQPNVIFTNRRSAERCFPETAFARISFCRTLNRLPTDGGQNFKQRNVERLKFRNFKFANIKITKDEFFDSFIMVFFHFLNIIWILKIFNNFSNCKILIFQMVK